MLPKLRTATVAVSDDSTMPTVFPHIRPADIILLKQGRDRAMSGCNKKEKLIGPILFLYYDESLVSSNLNSKPKSRTATGMNGTLTH